MTIDLYYVPGSAPVRAVRLVAAAVGVPLNLKLVDLNSGEQLKPQFLKMNIQHTVPTLDDNGFYLSESRAIITYLVEKYAKDDKLYPKEPKARAAVNQKLYFDIGTLYQRLADYYYPVVFAGATFDPAGLPKIDQAFEWLDAFLDGQEFVAGKTLTIADLAIAVTVSTYEALQYNFTKYKNVVRWFNNIKKIAPGYEEANGKGAKIFADAAAPFVKQ